MIISYKKLWKLLIDKDLKKKDLREMTGISPSTIAKMGRNKNINTEVIIKICQALKCDICDILELVSEKNKDEQNYLFCSCIYV